MKIEIIEYDEMDTVVWVDIGLTLMDGTIVFMEVHLDIERHEDEIIIRPFRCGSVIFRDPHKPLDLSNCFEIDRSDNKLEVLQSLARRVDIILEPYPYEDDTAIWNIEKALDPHFHVKGQSVPNRQWFLEAIEELLQDAFPADMLIERDLDPKDETPSKKGPINSV